MNNIIIYEETLPDSSSFYNLYKTTDWDADNTKSSETLYKALSNSWYIVSVYNDDKLVGCGRIISDGYLHAYINEMIIDPTYQGIGIGTTIIDLLLKKALAANIKDIQLFCAKGKKEFYLKSGFVERPNDAPGMQYKIN